MKVKLLTFLFFIFAVSSLINVIYAAGEGTNKTINSSGVALSPPYYDLGNLRGSKKTFTATVRNNIADAELVAKVENKGSDHVTVCPSRFYLCKNKTKVVTITVTNDSKLKIGPYDLTISFIATPKKGASINAISTNSLRLVFKKPGFAICSCNVGDIGPVQTTPFYIIMGNFTNSYKSLNTTITIRNKASGALIYQYHYSVPMNFYPHCKYFGTVKLPLPVKPWKFGDYVFHMTAKDGCVTVLTYDKIFNVGIMKGELKKVETRNVQKGEPAVFNAVVKNIGNQKLPVTVKIAVKDRANKTVYEQTQTDTLLKGTTKDFHFTWPTKYLHTGKYSIDYSVNMGNDLKTGKLYFKILATYICLIIFFICFVILLIGIFLIIIKCRCKKKPCRHHRCIH